MSSISNNPSRQQGWLKLDIKLYALFLGVPFVVYLGVTIQALSRHGLGISVFSYDLIQSGGTILVILGLAFGASGLSAIRERMRNPNQTLDRIWFQKLSRLLTARTLFRIGVILIFDTLLIVTYLSLKQYTPILNPNLYDAQLIALDRFVHLGMDPYPDWISPLPDITTAVQVTYAAWFGLKIPIFAYFLFKGTGKAVHFFSSYYLLFIVAGSIAIAFPSLGPVYMVPNARVDQMRARSPTLQSQLKALEWYEKAKKEPKTYVRNPIGGLAAFPSLHVGMVALAAIFFCRKRVLRWLFLVYLLLIEFGSVYLGWHYAIDGYFSILLAMVIVWLVGFPLAHLSGQPQLNPIAEVLRGVAGLQSPFQRTQKTARK